MSVFFEDECHLNWGDACGYVWGKKSERIEIPITNEREKQTYYGVIDYRTKEVIIKEYQTANSENTVQFLKYLQEQRPDQRIAIIWDGASYHKYGETKKYLEEINKGLPENEWRITCVLFAPNAPEQNPVEDIWLKGKNHVRRNHNLAKTFKDVKNLFCESIALKIFNFKKLFIYNPCSQFI